MELVATLLPYQEEAVEWCGKQEDKCAILAYDMGLGKTVITCGLLVKKPIKTLIMVPTSLIHQWKAELSKHTNGIDAVIYHGSNRKYKSVKDAIKESQIIISTTAIIANDIKNGVYLHCFRDIQRWVIDEAHKLRNSKNKIYKQLYSIAPLLRNKVFLTGTPICNSSNDLVSLISLSNIECENWKNSENAVKYSMLEKLIPDILKRKKNTEVLSDILPNISENIHYLRIANEQQRNVYNYFTYEEEILRKIIRMRQSLNSHTQLLDDLDELDEFKDDKDDEDDKDDNNEISIFPVKMNKIQEIYDNVNKNDKIIIFSIFTKLLEQIYNFIKIPKKYEKNKYIKIYHGGLNISQRNEIINEFKNNDDTKILLINLRAGGVGLNLVEANHIILVEPYWNEAEQQQAISRVYRIGQKKSVNIHKLIVQNSIESWMVSLQKFKSNISKYLIDKDDKNQNAEDIITKRQLVRELFQQIKNISIPESNDKEGNEKITEIINQYTI
jgi:SNF2 family DNA or RNA helicase